MNAKQRFSCIGGFLGMLILILDGKTVLSGAQQGIDLCIKSVIPSLLPFFFVSGFLTNSFSGQSLTCLAWVRNLCSVPKGAESILITGFLGGYPVGARSIGDAYGSGVLHPQDAAHLLSFCSNAGPAFLFGMIPGLFESRTVPFTLWAIHIVSAILVSILHPSGPRREILTSKKTESIPVSTVLKTSLSVMAAVCGWVILFRVVIAFLNRWVLWSLPKILCVIMTGLLELTNGCCELSTITQPGVRFVLCSVFLAFGGVCVTMQTASVLSGLSLRHYVSGKLLQTLFSLLLSSAVVLNIGLPVFLFLVLLVILLGKIQKRSRNPLSVGV